MVATRSMGIDSEQLIENIREHLDELQSRLEQAEFEASERHDSQNMEMERLRTVIREEGQKWHHHHLHKGHFDKALYWEVFMKKATHADAE